MNEPRELPVASAVGTVAMGWWRMLHTSAMLLAMVLSPSLYARESRRVLAARICLIAGQILPRFILLSALVSIVLIHIVVVTAQSYGLSQYALGMVVRVLVVELLPLSAALFVTLRADMAAHSEFAQIAEIRKRGDRLSLVDVGSEPIRLAILPRIIANSVAVISLTTISGAIALVTAYLRVYGPTPWGIESFTRTVGQVFEPIVILSLGLKTLLFSLAVATIPVTASLVGLRDQEHAPVTVPQGTVRLFILLIVIEVCSLTAEFY